MIGNFAYLTKVYIHHFYYGVIFILKSLRIKAKIPKTEGMGGNQITYMKHIKIRLCHMRVIFAPKHMVWQRQQFVRIHSQIMHYHTGNISCDVVSNVQVLIFLNKKQMINILTLVLQFDFTCII